jgi:hypothetical protein
VRGAQRHTRNNDACSALGLIVHHFPCACCFATCSCWAHAAGAVIEGAAYKAGKTVVPISMQWLVDCNREDGQKQCSGGFPTMAYKFATTNTPATEAEYPYVATPGTECKVKEGSAGYRVTSSGFAARCAATSDDASLACNNPDEAGLLKALNEYGPITVTVDASNWQAYDGGIMPSYACKHDWMSGNHAVVIVGFGTSGEEDTLDGGVRL